MHLKIVTQKELILASQSKQRAELLQTLGVTFKVAPSHINETLIDHQNHAVRAAKVAKEKALAAAREFPTACIISADTFVELDGKRIEKPTSLINANRTLHDLSGRKTLVHTGWCYIDPQSKNVVNTTTSAELSFRQLDAVTIERYVRTQPVLNWAGAFSLINVEGIGLISEIRGSLTAVLGLPIEEIEPLLRSSGFFQQKN